MVQTRKWFVHQFWCVPTTGPSPKVERWRRSFGRRLRDLREDRELSQERLAQLVDVDRKLIYRTELGQTSPRLDVVVRIAQALKVEPGELIGPGLK